MQNYVCAFISRKKKMGGKKNEKKKGKGGEGWNYRYVCIVAERRGKKKGKMEKEKKEGRGLSRFRACGPTALKK